MAVHQDAALAHHRDDPGARCSDDMSAERRPTACLAAHQDALAPGLKEVRRDADNAARWKVRQQGAEHQVLRPQDALPWARFPALQLAVAERRVVEQM
jgi:hypothetical protein